MIATPFAVLTVVFHGACMPSEIGVRRTNDRDPRHEEVRLQLERILENPLFKRSTRLSAFLRYVVEQTLAGRATASKNRSWRSSSTAATATSTPGWIPSSASMPAAFETSSASITSSLRVNRSSSRSRRAATSPRSNSRKPRPTRHLLSAQRIVGNKPPVGDGGLPLASSFLWSRSAALFHEPERPSRGIAAAGLVAGAQGSTEPVSGRHHGGVLLVWPSG